MRKFVSEPTIVFMGSPDFAVPVLKALDTDYSLLGVVTQPDRPSGRGRKVTSPPIKKLADELGLNVVQPRRLSDPEAMAQLEIWQPDLIVVAAFGQILKKDVLNLPRFGCINVHASLLPRWRGAAPIQAAILHGDTKTGITIMKMDIGLDTGPILSQWAIPISSEDTAGILSLKLAQLGAELLIETIPGYLAGNIQPQPQVDDLSTYAPMVKKSDGKLDFTKSVDWLARQVRAYQPWPGSFIMWQNSQLKIVRATAIPQTDHPLETGHLPGQRTIYKDLPAVFSIDGILLFNEIQPPGKKVMGGDAFLRGTRNWIR